VSRNPYEEQRTGFKYIIKLASYKSSDAQNKSVCILRARNFVQCNEINLHVLLSACSISVEMSAEHRFPSGLPAVGAAPRRAAPRHFPVNVRS